jgi:hypothetical protein
MNTGRIRILTKYIIKYWFEYGGFCLWAVNDNAENKYGYAINNNKLPISKSLIDELYALEEEYQSSLNWEYPPDPSPWTLEQKQDFTYRANAAYLKLLSELGNDFEVINEIDNC